MSKKDKLIHELFIGKVIEIDNRIKELNKV